MTREAVLQLFALALFPASLASGADCNRNAVVDIEEIRSGALPDCNGNGVPDSCDIAPVNYGLVSSGSIFVGQSPIDVTVDDIDGDGDADVVAINGQSPEVVVLWNDGRGRLASPARWSTGQPSMSLVAADLDKDGRKDLVIGGNVGISVLFQVSQRWFNARFPPRVLDPQMQAMAGGDLDGDSDVDLAVTVPFGVRVLMNDGTGAFTSLDLIPIGSNPFEVIAARLDDDEDIDLVTSNNMPSAVPFSNISVLINRGDGSFETARNYSTGPNPGAMISGDLDGDGDADVATSSLAEEEITVLLGDHHGRFSQSAQLAAGRLIFGLASADMDGDGNQDLAAAGLEKSSPAGVSVFLNHGRAEFARRPVDLETGTQPRAIGAADMDGDGSADLIVSAADLSSVTIFQRSEVAYSTDCNSNLRPDDCELEGNDCNGNELPDECDLASRASADCDQDGMPDECQPDCNGNTIADTCDIASGFAADCNRNGLPDDCDIRGTGLGFETTFLPMTSFTRLLSSSDLDADGREDLYAIADPADLLVFWNSGAEGFLPETRFPAGLEVTDSAAGDLDGDADRDIVLADAEASGLRVIENRGSRSFGEGPKLQAPIGVNTVSTVDLDGDQDLDLATTTFEGSVVVFENRGGGTFGEFQRVGGAVSGRILEAADFDADGRADLVADSGPQDSVVVFWNDGSLAFKDPTFTEPKLLIQSMAVADADDDGDLDVFVSSDRLVLFRNSGARAFAFEEVAQLQGVGPMLPGDLDRDGDQDLAAIFFGFQLAALLNRGDGAFDPPLGIAAVVDLFNSVTAGDWNGDGGMDLALMQSLFCPDCPIPLLPVPPTNGPQLLILTNVTKPPVSRDIDRDGVPDDCRQRPFHRGDADGDGVVNLTDPVFTLRHLFQGEPAPACLEAADTTNDARLEMTDAIATLEFIFRGGPPPAPPGPPPAACGPDTDPPGSAGDMGCGAYEGCRV